jgi:hypothetical protein
MLSAVPDLPRASLEVRVLRIATENLLELQIEGADVTAVDLELDTALECRGELTSGQMLALLLRNLVERLLLLDASLCTDLARFEDLEDRSRVAEDPRPKGTGLLRRLTERAVAVVGSSAQPLEAIFLPGADGGSKWEQALQLPGLASEAERAAVLRALSRMLALDPTVVDQVMPHHQPVRVRRNSLRPFPRPGRAMQRRPEVRREARLSAPLTSHELGDRMVVALNPSGAAADLRPVVVREVEGDAEIVFPTTSTAWPDLGRFSRSAAGYEVPVNLSAPAGTHRYLVALVPCGFDVDWAAPEEARWQPIRDGIAQGRFEAEDFEVEVAGVAPQALLTVSEAGGRWSIAARVDGAPASGSVDPGLSGALGRRIRAIQDTLTVSMSLGLAREAAWADAEREIGQSLFELATANPRLWKALGGALRGRAAAGRLDLRCEGASVAALPWELMTGGVQGEPLGLRTGWSVTRRTAGISGPARGGLEVVGVPNPDDLSGLGPALSSLVTDRSQPSMVVLDLPPTSLDLIGPLTELAETTGLRIVAPRRGWSVDLADAFLGATKARLASGAAPVDAASEGRRAVAALRTPGPGRRWYDILVYSPG